MQNKGQHGLLLAWSPVPPPSLHGQVGPFSGFSSTSTSTFVIGPVSNVDLISLVQLSYHLPGLFTSTPCLAAPCLDALSWLILRQAFGFWECPHFPGASWLRPGWAVCDYGFKSVVT